MAASSPMFVHKTAARDRKSNNVNMDIVNAISQNTLKSLQSHFNWHIYDDITDSTLKERIDLVSSHINLNPVDILPQSFCLLAYLISKSNENKEVTKNLDLAYKSLSDIRSWLQSSYTWKLCDLGEQIT